jgi:hypothetical protein
MPGCSLPENIGPGMVVKIAAYPILATNKERVQSCRHLIKDLMIYLCASGRRQGEDIIYI